MCVAGLIAPVFRLMACPKKRMVSIVSLERPPSVSVTTITLLSGRSPGGRKISDEYPPREHDQGYKLPLQWFAAAKKI